MGSNQKKETLQRSGIQYALTCLGLIHGMPGLLISLVIIQINGIYIHARCTAKMPTSAFFQPAISSLMGTLALVFYIQDTGFSFIMNPYSLQSKTVLFCFLASFSSMGIFPVHSFTLVNILDKRFFGIFDSINPIYIALPIVASTIGEHSNFELSYLIPVSIYLIGSALYFTLASFTENDVAKFFCYIYLEIGLLTIASVPFIEIHHNVAVATFYLSTIVALAGLVVSLNILEKRYGKIGLKKFSGYHKKSKNVGYCYLFFVLVLSNTPLTLSFLGEDIILHNILKQGVFFGIMFLSIFTLAGISLYRSYCRIFGGESKKYPETKLFIHEKIALVSSFIIGVSLPFFGFIL